MYRKGSVVYILLAIFFLVNILLRCDTIYAQSTVELVTDPDERELLLGITQLITIQARGVEQDWSIKWEISGPGELKGDRTASSIIYTSPRRIGDQSAKTVITAIVTDDKGKTVKKSVTFHLIDKASFLAGTGAGFMFWSSLKNRIEDDAETEYDISNSPFWLLQLEMIISPSVSAGLTFETGDIDGTATYKRINITPPQTEEKKFSEKYYRITGSVSKRRGQLGVGYEKYTIPSAIGFESGSDSSTRAYILIRS